MSSGLNVWKSWHIEICAIFMFQWKGWWKCVHCFNSISRILKNYNTIYKKIHSHKLRPKFHFNEGQNRDFKNMFIKHKIFGKPKIWHKLKGLLKIIIWHLSFIKISYFKAKNLEWNLIWILVFINNLVS